MQTHVSGLNTWLERDIWPCIGRSLGGQGGRWCGSRPITSLLHSRKLKMAGETIVKWLPYYITIIKLTTRMLNVGNMSTNAVHIPFQAVNWRLFFSKTTLSRLAEFAPSIASCLRSSCKNLLFANFKSRNSVTIWNVAKNWRAMNARVIVNEMIWIYLK